MATIFVSLDATRPAREAEKQRIADLQAEEVKNAQRLAFEYFSAATRTDRAEVMAWYAENFPPSGWSSGENSFPFNRRWQELAEALKLIAYSEVTQADHACSVCGSHHDRLWTIERSSRAYHPFGHFPVYHINGGPEVIDGTLPTVLTKLPRDAKPVAPAEADRIWHSTSHCFGSTVDMGELLRTAPIVLVLQADILK